MRRAAGILVGVIVAASLAFQLWQLHRFVNAGPRFTADDGHELCNRVAALERRLDLPSPPCL